MLCCIAKGVMMDFVANAQRKNLVQPTPLWRRRDFGFLRAMIVFVVCRTLKNLSIQRLSVESPLLYVELLQVNISPMLGGCPIYRCLETIDIHLNDVRSRYNILLVLGVVGDYRHTSK